MAFSIKDENVDKDVRILAGMTGESLTQAVGVAVRERIAHLEHASDVEKQARYQRLNEFLATLPKVKPLSLEEHKRIADELWEP